MRSRFSTTLLVLLGSTAVLATAGSSAPTAFPGPNGKMTMGAAGAIRLMYPDGSALSTFPVPGGTAPVWSADGRFIAYSVNRDPWTIRVVRVDGTGDREVLPAGRGDSAMHNAYAWSPTGAEIAYQCSGGLCAVRVADGTTRRILDLQLSTAETIRPTWSPDGSKIALQCRFDRRQELCMVNADGTDPVVFVSDPGLSERSPDWSPDGSRLLFGSTGRLHTLDVDDGEVRQIVDVGTSPPLLRPHWSPDGQRIAFAVTGSSPGTYVVGASGGQPVRISSALFEDWGTSPAVTVSASSLEPRWVLSRQTGRVQLRGTASHASTLSVAFRVAGRTYPPTSVSVPAGDYAVSIPLPRDLLPGALEILVGGTSGSEPLLTVARAETLPAPATGLVSRTWISVIGAGAPRTRVPRGTKALVARFAFSVRPAAGQRLRVVWLSPSGASRTQRVASARVVSTSIASGLGLQRGRWRCRLEAGRTPLAIASVRVG